MIYLKFFLVISFYYSAFVIVHYAKYGVLSLQPKEVEFLIFLLATTLISSLLTRKFKKLKNKDFLVVAKNYFKTFVVNIGLLSLVINFIHEFSTSRILIFGSVSLGFLFEFIFIGIQSEYITDKSDKKNRSFSKVFLFIDFILLLGITFYAFLGFDFSMYSVKSKFLFLLVFYSVWFVNGIINREFDKKQKNISVILWNHSVSYLMLFLITSSIVFLLGIPLEVKKVIIYLLLFFSVLSTFVVVLYYLYKTVPKTDNVIISLLRTTNSPEKIEFPDNNKVNLQQDTNGNKYYGDKLDKNLRNRYLKDLKSVYLFLSNNLSLETINSKKSVILRSADIYNVDILQNNSLHFYMNLHELNDIREINKYLANINLKLQNQGIFVGRLITNKLKHKRLHKNYPFYLANLLYFFDFIWNRVFTKLPILNRLQIIVSKGKNRSLSMAEGLGRLYYSGFEVKCIKEIDDSLYFIARKNTKPLGDKNPSYGIIFKMRRTGANGKEIFVYKMRTMYPYSEYIQKFVHDNFSLKEGGKFENDFRITSWGALMRKLWIDELPMLINVFKGELKIVGVRPLSKHYLSLYSIKLKNIRNKHKPGLIPPYYADLPKTLEEIMNSEEKYFASYEKNPLATDIKYFFKILKNIFIKRARSA